MRVLINQVAYDLSNVASVAEAVAAAAAKPPFAVAVNLQFVPRTQYQSVALQADDRIEIISPVTGG
jgi:sulfur carrier protein